MVRQTVSNFIQTWYGNSSGTSNGEQLRIDMVNQVVRKMVRNSACTGESSDMSNDEKARIDRVNQGVRQTVSNSVQIW